MMRRSQDMVGYSDKTMVYRSERSVCAIWHISSQVPFFHNSPTALVSLPGRKRRCRNLADYGKGTILCAFTFKLQMNLITTCFAVPLQQNPANAGQPIRLVCFGEWAFAGWKRSTPDQGDSIFWRGERRLLRPCAVPEPDGPPASSS